MNDKQLRALAHANLRYWAESRAKALEGLGSDGISITERMRQRAHGGGGSTKPNRLTGPERQAGANDRVLRIEQAVRMLPDLERAAIRWKYLDNGTVSAWAEGRGIPQRTAADVVSRAMKKVGRDLEFGNKQKETNRRTYWNLHPVNVAQSATSSLLETR